MAEKSPCYQCTREIKCPECHTFCPDFIAWDIVHSAMREADFQKREISNGLYTERSKAVAKADKMWRKK